MNDKIQVLERAFQLLEFCALDTSRPHTVGELSEVTGLKIQTVSKIVRTMSVLGYLENTGRKTGYVMGERILRLSEDYHDIDELRRLVFPFLKEYADTVGEYICFSVLRGSRRRIVCKIRGKNADPRYRYSYPAEEEAFASLSGICLVSHLPESRQLKFFQRFGPPPFWGAVSEKEYLRRMKQISSKEFQISDTFMQGQMVISCSVIYGNELIGEIGSFMRLSQYTETALERIRTIAKRISIAY